MLILLEITAVLAIIVLPLIRPGKKIKKYKKDTDMSKFVIGADGAIHGDDTTGHAPAKNDFNTTL